MRRKKTAYTPLWLMWEGDDFPRSLHSDSIVFYLPEHVYLDHDDIVKKALARQLQIEGIVETLGEAFNLIANGSETRAGYFYEDGDELYPIYCDEDDSLLDYDATFVEVPVVL